MEKKLTDLKVGDTVFVVHQQRRNDKEIRTAEMQVVKIGSKYAYLQLGSWDELKFHKDSGISAHGDDCNARANGFGFDVYLSREDWEKEVADRESMQRLRMRMVRSYGQLIELQPETVSQIHAILDKAGIE